MKKSFIQSIAIHSFVVFLFMGLTFALAGQETVRVSAPLPDNVNKIVTASCMPCHSSTGGMLSRGKLNFNEWTGYSAEKQKEKAKEMYKEVSKNKMPPKNARETRPEIIPTKEQVDIIKKWADSL
jgi:hypothetical protein